MSDSTIPTVKISGHRGQRCAVPQIRGTCAAPVPADAPMPMCVEHLAQAWSYCREKITAQRQRDVADAAARAQQRARDAFAKIDPIMAEMQRLSVGYQADLDRIRAEAAAEAVELAAYAEAADADSVVYYVKFGDRIKIGFTRNLRRRLTDLPHDEVLATEPGGQIVEAMRHRQFAKHRIIREWFASAPDLLTHIAELNAPAEVRRARSDERRDRVGARAAAHQRQIEGLRARLTAIQADLLVSPDGGLDLLASEESLLMRSASYMEPLLAAP